MRLTKGHGTENDFLVLPDLDGTLGAVLTPPVVRALCDRHRGLGADGVLRVVRAENDPAGKQSLADSQGATDLVVEYFMDYRNADGSIAEMCGNGIRVFHRYLLSHSLVEPIAAVATRGGIRCVRARGDGDVTVTMGLPRLLADRPIATAATLDPDRAPVSAAGTAVQMPNPHVVVDVAPTAELEALDLRRAPAVEPGLPHGQNVEFVVRLGPRHLRMRVHERGVGETRSCGTGICAAAVAVAAADGAERDASTWLVDVPGGRCEVLWRTDGEVELTGPAVLVGDIDVDDDWLAAAPETLPETMPETLPETP